VAAFGSASPFTTFPQCRGRLEVEAWREAAGRGVARWGARAAGAREGKRIRRGGEGEEGGKGEEKKRRETKGK
jgi:hypothetical protein